MYKGNPLTMKMFEESELDIELLYHPTTVRREVLNSVIAELERLRPGNANLKILRTYVESLEEPSIETSGTDRESNYFPDLAIGSFDLQLTHRRREIYNYWEKVAKKYKKVIDASKAIITEYDSGKDDGYEELDDDMSIDNQKSFRATFKKLVENIDNPNDRNNYVVELKPTNIIATDLHEGRLHNIVMIWFNTIEKIELSFSGGVDYGKDKEGHVDRSAWEDDSGATPEEIRQYEAQEDEMRRRFKEEKSGARKLMRTKILVDPLLAYLVNNNKIEIGAYSKTESDSEVKMGIKRQIRRIKSIMDEADDESIVAALEEYVDNIKGRASDASKDDIFHLPFTAQVDREFGMKTQEIHWAESLITGRPLKRENILLLHRNFLSAVNTLIQPDKELDRTIDPVDQSPLRAEESLQHERSKTPYPEPVGYTTGQEGKLREHSGKMKGLINKLIAAIDDYYVDPANSQYYPFHRDEADELFSDLDVVGLKRTLQVHWKKPSKGNWKAMSVMAKQFNRHGIGFVTYTQMKDIVDWLKALKHYEGKNINRLIRKAQNAYDALEEITTLKGIGRTLTNENQIYFAKYIDLMAKKNGNDITDERFPEYGGSLISELAPQYDDANEEYPMKALRKWIGARKKSFTKTDLEGTTLSKRKRAIMHEYLGMTKVTKSDVENNILVAHDTIRKIVGKPTYFAFGDTSDFDDVNNTIDVVKKSYNVELMPIEIENIVNDFNSHRELSKKYGLSEEVIYRVKAMYR